MTYHPAESEDDEVRCALCGKRVPAEDANLEEVLVYGTHSEQLPVCAECQS